MTKREFDEMCRGAREDYEADSETDGEYMTIDQVAYDMADSMLYSADTMAYMKKTYPGKSRDILKEILADHLCG